MLTDRVILLTDHHTLIERIILNFVQKIFCINTYISNGFRIRICMECHNTLNVVGYLNQLYRYTKSLGAGSRARLLGGGPLGLLTSSLPPFMVRPSMIDHFYHFGPFWTTILDHFGPLLTIFDHYQPFLTILTIFDHFDHF